MAQSKRGLTTVMFAPFVLPQLGMRPSPQENWSFDSGYGRVVLSGKINGVVAANVIRHAALPTVRQHDRVIRN